MFLPRTLVFLLALFAVSGPIRVQDPAPPAEGAPSAGSEFDARLKKNPFFQKILWTTDSSYAPFDILIQKQAVPEQDFERKVTLFFGPWLLQMAKVFGETVATPAKLEPGLDPKPIRLIVLLTEGDYLNYSKTTHTRDGFGRSAFYDDRFRAVVTYWDVPGAANLRRYSVLRRFVFALLHQRSSAASGRQAPLWLREGISSALAWHVGTDPATAFAKPLIDPAAVDSLVNVSQNAARQNVFLQPLRALATVVSVNDLWKRVQYAAEALDVTIREDEDWYEGYRSQSVLWVNFLRREGAAAHNRSFEAYLRAGMDGGGSAADLEKAFEGQDLAALDREFFQWVYARARESGKGSPDESRLATLFTRPLTPDAAQPAYSPGAALAASLAPPIGEPQVAQALALRKASRGDIEGAIADLTKRVEAVKDDPSLLALRTEIARLTAWKGARDAWLADLIANNGRLQIERDGKKIMCKPTRFETGVLQLESTKGKEELPVVSLEPAGLAGQMKATPASSPEWVRAYGMILGADARWEKLLKDKSPESQALRADAAGAYVELRLIGVAAEHLAALAQDASPANAAAANSVLERLHRVRLEVPTQPLILQRLDALRSLARAAATKVYDETHPKPEFAGKTTWLDASTVELNYDFNAPNEADDWVERPDDFTSWRQKMEPLEIPEKERRFKIADGAWVGQGSFVFRHTLPFEAPIEVHAVVRHGKASNEEADLGHFLIRICDDGSGNYIALSETGEIFVRDSRTNKDVYAPMSRFADTDLDKDVEVEVTHDGEKVRLVHGGITESEQPVGSRRSGNFYLVVHTNRELAIESLKIRGKLGVEAMSQLRERWITNAVLKTGLL